MRLLNLDMLRDGRGMPMHMELCRSVATPEVASFDKVGRRLEHTVLNGDVVVPKQALDLEGRIAFG